MEFPLKCLGGHSPHVVQAELRYSLQRADGSGKRRQQVSDGACAVEWVCVRLLAAAARRQGRVGAATVPTCGRHAFLPPGRRPPFTCPGFW